MMKALENRFMFAAALLILLPLGVHAARQGVVERTSPSREPATDQEFLVKAISANLAEINFAEKALKESDNKDVRAFARQMVDDHTRAKDSLMRVAKSMRVAVVEGTEKDVRDEMSRLSKLRKGDFDREYMSCMVKNHEKVAKMCKTWSTKATDSELREAAGKIATTAEDHLKKAREIRDKLKGS
jgi:putative membrane protein